MQDKVCYIPFNRSRNKQDMTSIQELFFELLRVSLGQQDCLSRRPERGEWQALLDIAQDHTVVGICLSGLEKLNSQQLVPPKDILLQWIGIGQQIEISNKVLNEQCLLLSEKLNKDGKQCCFLKGQGNATMYGRIWPQLILRRQSGDIDVWVKGGFDRVIRYVQKESPTDDVNEQHVHFHFFEDAEVEIHYTPSRLANRFLDKRLQHWFMIEEERQMNHAVDFNGGQIVLPTSDFNLVYQMLHIYGHLFNEGIGLRQLMDYFVLLSTYDFTEAEIRSVRDNVARFGMRRFASALMWLLGYVFHLPKDKMPWPPEENRGVFLLSEVMQMGNFGHSDSRFNHNVNDSHLNRFLQTAKSKIRFVKYFPGEALWQPIDMFLLFFELRLLRRKVRHTSSSLS